MNIDARKAKMEDEMMNQGYGWMGGSMGGGMWVWTVLMVVVVALLGVLVARVSRR